MKLISTLLLFLFTINSSFSQLNWAFALKGSDGVSKITQDIHGDLIVTGAHTSATDFDPSQNTYQLKSNAKDIFLAKYDENYNLKWAITVGGTYTDLVKGLVTDNNGNIYISGSFISNIVFAPGDTVQDSGTHGFLAKYDSNGKYLWAVTLTGSNSEGSGLTVDPLNRIYMTGKMQSGVGFDPSNTSSKLEAKGGSDIFVAQYDSNGNLGWAFSVGSNSTYSQYTYNETGHDIKYKNGYLYITGAFAGTKVEFNPREGISYKLNSKGLLDPFLAKYDILGNIQWAISIAASSSSDIAYALDLDNEENIYLTGGIYYSADFDPSEDTATITTAGGQDVFVAKYNRFGKYLWAFTAGGTNFDEYGLGIDVTNNGDLFLTGTYHGISDFDPSPARNTNTGSSNKYGQTFVAGYDTAGSFKWVVDIGLEGYSAYNYDFGRTICAKDDGTVFVGGSFLNKADFDPSSGTWLLTYNSYVNGFVASYRSNDFIPLNVEQAIGESNFLSIFPNPSGEHFTIQAGEPFATIEFTDHSGRSFKTVPGQGHSSLLFDRALFPSGIYYVRAISVQGRSGSCKLIIP